jgi:hypothetical protein
MNKVPCNRLIGAQVAAALLLAGACENRSSEPAQIGDTATYRTHDGRVVFYRVAPEAKLVEVEVKAAGRRTIIQLTTGSPISTSGGPLAIDVHFSDRREVAFVRNFAYPCPDSFDRAAVLDVRTGAVLGKVDVAVDGSRIELAFDSSLVTGQPRIAVSRYLPSREALAEALRGLEGAYASIFKFGSSGTMHAAVPFAGASRFRSAEPPIERTIHFGPPPGTTNFDPAVPVIQIPSGEGTIDVVDHESNWPNDGDYDTGYKDSCDNPILCGWFTWKAKVSFIGGCGADLDRDGRLIGNELRWYFGFCAFPSALNDTWQDSSGFIHWENFGRGEDANEIYAYTMVPTTGELGVQYSEDRGRTWRSVYEGLGQGGPGGWRLFPAPPARPPTCTVAAQPGPQTDPDPMELTRIEDELLQPPPSA